MNTIFDYKMKSLQGKEVSFKDYEGNVFLIVNTASKCGFTPQYEGLEKLHRKYKNQGLIVMGFPCNQFLGQEPGDVKDIQEGCLINYGVTFNMSEKIDVNGEKEHPLFTFLKKQAPFNGYPIKEIGDKLDAIHEQQKNGFNTKDNIRWNFTKFLVAKDGRTVMRFESMITPESLQSDIEKFLNE
ncbi:MAG: glutathione peroxidase [Bacteroidales bacterium]